MRTRKCYSFCTSYLYMFKSNSAQKYTYFTKSVDSLCILRFFNDKKNDYTIRTIIT